MDFFAKPEILMKKREVDLVEKEALRNPFRSYSILRLKWCDQLFEKFEQFKKKTLIIFVKKLGAIEVTAIQNIKTVIREMLVD